MARWGSTNALAPKWAAFSPYTTVVVSTGFGDLHGFNYRIGDSLPGTVVYATQRDTNMVAAGEILDKDSECEFIGLEWCLQAVTPAEFRQNLGVPYHLTDGDILEFTRRVFMRLEINGKSVFELAPDRYEMVRDAMGARQRVPFPQPLRVGHHDYFRIRLTWPRGGPQFADPAAVLTLVIRLLTQDEKQWIQYGRWSSDKDDKTKAYVVVGKEGLDELLAELLGVPPEEVKEEK